jgi:hypothetical protein
MNNLLKSLVGHYSSADTENRDVKFFKKDGQDFLRWGVIGFFLFGTYNLSLRMLSRQVDRGCELLDSTDRIRQNKVLCHAFLELQNYRQVNIWMFKTAIINADHLLILEQGLMNEDIIPIDTDKNLAFTHFKVCVSRLNAFQHKIKETMSLEHAFLVNSVVKTIYETLQKHVLNIFHLCSQYKPENLMKRARQEIHINLHSKDGVKDMNTHGDDIRTTDNDNLEYVHVSS